MVCPRVVWLIILSQTWGREVVKGAQFGKSHTIRKTEILNEWTKWADHSGAMWSVMDFTREAGMFARTGTIVGLVLVLSASLCPAAEPLRSLVRKCWPVPAEDPLTRFATDLTALEDEIRITGSITIKHPDVWGESNLMDYLQEYDQLLRTSVQHFDQNLQALIARSDQADLTASFSIGQGLGTGTAPAATVTTITTTPPDKTATNTVSATPVAIGPPDLKSFLPSGPTSSGIGLEPTEVERQRSTFIKVNQALRRRNIGDDNSRAAGYGLYLFRIPVSVIPGRETFEGHSALVTLRAQLAIDPNHLRDTFPKLVIAEIVEDLVPLLEHRWTQLPAHCPQPQPAERAPVLQTMSLNQRIAATTNSSAAANYLYGACAIDAVLAAAKCELGSGVPRQLELRNFLWAYFSELHIALAANQLYAKQTDVIQGASEAFVKGRLSNNQLSQFRQAWCCQVKSELNSSPDITVESTCETKDCDDLTPNPDDTAAASWCLAAQAGLLNYNLRENLASLAHAGQVAPHLCDEGHGLIEFYNPDANPDTLAAWEALIRTEFPVHVFTLEPDIEEQNAYDVFTRQRQLQLAFAYAVASGNINAAHAMSFTRQLELDMASISLNRTTVGFSHSNDTFGWYFYPRVQSPPEERSNIVAFGRLLWSTGPTGHYDLRHRRLDPGIRECEVLVAMPSFVTGVTFDVTTNWERLVKPGCLKRSYEQMLAQGARVQMIRSQLRYLRETPCTRPGDMARLVSRLDQLEAMLPLQTETVAIPYEYELPASELYGKGNEHLRPVLSDYYGLHYTSTGSTAEVFIVGRHFHPTQTYVVAAGSASLPAAASPAPTPTADGTTKPAAQDKTPPQPGGQAGQGGAQNAGRGGPGAGSNVHLALVTAQNPPISQPSDQNAGPPSGQGAVQGNGKGQANGGDSPPAFYPEVKVLSRELLLVRLHTVTSDLTMNPISVRVGTPAGVSNELVIPFRDGTPSKGAPPGSQPAPAGVQPAPPADALETLPPAPPVAPSDDAFNAQPHRGVVKRNHLAARQSEVLYTEPERADRQDPSAVMSRRPRNLSRTP